jgi:ferredoxin
MGGASRAAFRLFGRASGMAVDLEKCTLCGRCREMCPFHAIEIVNRQVAVDRGKCQFCMCCTEVCRSGAIRLKGMLQNKGRVIAGGAAK